MRQSKARIHIKNNLWDTPESQEIFTITPERYQEAAARHPDVAAQLSPFFDRDLDHFAESMKSAEILVTWDLPTENLAAVAPKLRLIHIIGAGVEHLYPFDWLPKTVTLVNNKGAHSRKAGEFGLMSVLMLHNHVPALVAQQAQCHWKSLYSTLIEGRVLLIVGVGSIGAGVARNAKQLGMTVLGVSRHGRPTEGVDEMTTVAGLDGMLPRADFVFVATPSTPETRNLLDRRRLSLMKRGSGLVNVGRAAVVDYDALGDLLRSDHLGGAILDVFDPEPLPADSPLWRIPNLLVTPHVSADDGVSYVQITLDLVFDNVRRYFAGEPLRNVVRADLGY